MFSFTLSLDWAITKQENVQTLNDLEELTSCHGKINYQLSLRHDFVDAVVHPTTFSTSRFQLLHSCRYVCTRRRQPYASLTELTTRAQSSQHCNVDVRTKLAAITKSRKVSTSLTVKVSPFGLVI